MLTSHINIQLNKRNAFDSCETAFIPAILLRLFICIEQAVRWIIFIAKGLKNSGKNAPYNTVTYVAVTSVYIRGA